MHSHHTPRRRAASNPARDDLVARIEHLEVENGAMRLWFADTQMWLAELQERLDTLGGQAA